MSLPLVQSFAPEFTGNALLPSREFGTVTINEYRGKWLVFFWYPLNFT